MQKLISIDIFADFGMLKKPDTNQPVYLTFNLLHKPALLGIIGAVIGEKGFQNFGVLPDYYLKLKDLQVGIQPLNHEKGNYQKTIITYNNSTGLASEETGGNLMVNEQTLIAPAYRCYILLDTENPLHQKIESNLKNRCSEYLPYLGKNEFSIWWNEFKEYKYSEFSPKENFKIDSIYIKDTPIEGNKEVAAFMPFITETGNTFSFFERLPIGYIEYEPKQFQYEYRSFAYTDWSLKENYKTPHKLLKTDSDVTIQVF